MPGNDTAQLLTHFCFTKLYSEQIFAIVCFYTLMCTVKQCIFVSIKFSECFIFALSRVRYNREI